MRHLLHVGYPKAASTYLQKWFQQNPHMRQAGIGLFGFADGMDFVEVATAAMPAPDMWYVTSLEGYAVPYPPRMPIPGRLDEALTEVVADAFVKERQAQVCRLWQQIAPWSHVLIVTRGYKEMLQSIYSAYLQTGGQDAFDCFLERKHFFLQSWFDFDYLLGLYLDAFGPEQVLILPMELLQSDAQAFRQAIERFLNVPPHEAELGKINPGLSVVEKHWYPHFNRWSRAAARLLPARYRPGFHYWYELGLLYQGKLQRLAHLFDRLSRQKREAIAITGTHLQPFSGRDQRLRQNPVYAPYADAYLWTSINE